MSHDKREHGVSAFRAWVLLRRDGLSCVEANSGPGPPEEGRDLGCLIHINGIFYEFIKFSENNIGH